MSDFDDNPFRSLDKKKYPKNKGKKRKNAAAVLSQTQGATGRARGVNAVPAGAEEKREREAESEDVFLQAMQGVQPLHGVKGREVAPRVAAPSESGDGPVQAGEEAEVAGALADLVSGKVEFALEYSEEYIRGHVLGLDSKIVVRLKTGYYSPEAHLDLHGMNAEQAYGALLHFMKEHHMQGHRCVLLIPGRGKNSPEGYGVLRESVQRWLTRDPLKRVVLAFCTSLPKHGGAGALYVLLRKNKGKGKINWERFFGGDYPL